MTEEKNKEIDFSWMERQFAESLIYGILDVSPVLDRLSSWGMAGMAAMAIAMLSNLDNAVNLMSSESVKVVFAFSAISILLGIGQKTCYLIISIDTKVNDSAENRLSAIVSRVTGQANPDIWKYLRENISIAKGLLCVATAFPSFIRKKMIQNFLDDKPLDMSKHKANIFAFFRQAIYTIFQILFSVIIIIVISLSI